MLSSCWLRLRIARNGMQAHKRITKRIGTLRSSIAGPVFRDMAEVLYSSTAQLITSIIRQHTCDTALLSTLLLISSSPAAASVCS